MRQSDSDVFGRKYLRQAFRLWHDTQALGQLPLAAHQIVEKHRLVAGYRDGDSGQGMALRDVLREVLEQIRPKTGRPNPASKQWRYYYILTEQFIKQFSPDLIASQLHSAKRTYFREQNRAIDAIADRLKQRCAQSKESALTQISSWPYETLQWDDAVVTALCKAHEARKHFDVESALNYYEIAYAQLQQLPERYHTTEQIAAALDGRGWCLRMQGRMEDYVADSVVLLELGQSSADASVAALGLWRTAYAARWFGDYLSAREAAYRGIRAAREAEEQLQLARCWREVGVASRIVGDVEQAQFAFSEAIYCFSTVGDAVSEIHALGNMATLSTRQGNTAVAVRSAELSLALCTTHGMTYERRLALGDKGAALVPVEPDEAEHYLNESKTIAAQIDDHTQLVFCDGHLGWLFLQRGAADVAQAYFAAGLARAERFQSSAEMSWLHVGLAETFLHKQSYKRAAHHLMIALDHAQQKHLYYETQLALEAKDRIGQFVVI